MTYDRTYITEKFKGLIGFEPSFDVSNTDAQIDDDLADSSSGVYLNDLHALFTPENFANSVQQFSQFTVQAWSASSSYLKGKIVKHSGVIYKAIDVTDIGESPSTSPEKWAATTLLSEWFWKKYNSSVLSVIDRIMEEKKLNGHGKQLRGETSLFSRDGYAKDLVTKSSRFVGFEVNLLHPNMRIQLQRIGIQLDRALNVPIHIIYKDLDTEVELPYASTYKRFQTFDVSDQAFLSYEGPAIIGYYEDDLGAANAIYQNTTIFNSDYCTTCGGYDSGARSTWSQYAEINPVVIVDDEIEYVSDTNFGLNLVLSFYCDLSDVLIRQRDLLIPALKAQLLVTFMSEISNSIRANTSADVVANLAFNESKDWKDPDNPKYMLAKAIKAVSFDLSGLYDKCMPCQNKTNIRTLSI